jgi:type IV pilus assembly protein PilX
MSDRFVVTSRRERGMSLLFALMALVALSLAAVALVRTVGSGSQIIGNLGFKQDATTSADRGSELAVAWLFSNATGTTLQQDGSTGSGYYATSLDALDPTGTNLTATTRVVVDWDGNGCSGAGGTVTSCLRPSDPTTVNGNTVRYFITRLCSVAGAPTASGVVCATPLTSTTGEDTNKGNRTYSDPRGFDTPSINPYYRIVVRAVGARNTHSFTETIVHF